MRRMTIPLLAGLMGLALAAPLQAQDQGTLKIGYIDSQQIIQEAPGAQEARQELERDLSGYQAEVERMGQELQQAMQQFEQQRLTLSDQARETRQQEILDRQQEYQQRIQELEQQAARRQQELVDPIMQRINAVIEQIRREGSYTMIFDAASPGLIAADPGYDLTPEVIRRLREQTEGGAPATPSPSGSGDDNG